MRWRLGAADALNGIGRRHEAAELYMAATARGETLAVSGDEDAATARVPYIFQSYESGFTLAVAEGMEWARVVGANAQVLPVLARTGDEALLPAAVDRLQRLAYISGRRSTRSGTCSSRRSKR